jgi:hypothetical protein
MWKNGILILFVILGNGFHVAYPQEKQGTLPARKIRVDYRAEKAPHCKAFKECVGAGRANEGLQITRILE